MVCGDRLDSLILELFSNLSDPVTPHMFFSSEAGLRSKQQMQAMTETWGTQGRAEARPLRSHTQMNPSCRVMLLGSGTCVLPAQVPSTQEALVQHTGQQVRLADTGPTSGPLTVLFGYCGPE